MLKRIGGGLLFLVFLVAIVLYASGTFRGEQVEPGRGADQPGEPAPPARATAERAEVPLTEVAVGTVQSRMRVDVAAQVTGRVREVRAQAGATVKAGVLLVVLDARELQARLDQAQQESATADAARERAVQARARGEALLDQAKARRARIQRLLAGNAATPEQMEEAEAAFLQAQAGVADAQASIAAADARVLQVKKVVAEAEVALGHARIAAPIDGVVAERAVEPGDLAWPGRALLTVLDPGALRLEAQVREGMIANVKRGDRLSIELPAAGASVDGVVAEILPSADPQSRTFRVRVDFDPIPGVYPGMFGRLRIPAGTRTTIRIPATAVARVGQLETVLVLDDGRWSRRYVKTGAPLADGTLEVLSGLAGTETVGLSEATR